MRTLAAKPRTDQAVPTVARHLRDSPARSASLQTPANEPDALPGRTRQTYADYDFSRIPVHPPAPQAVQAKLAVGASHDLHEIAADEAAERVMQSPGPPRDRTCSCGGSCPDCRGRASALPSPRLLHARRHDSLDAGVAAAPPIVDMALRSGGRPLDQATRALMEPRFACDFSQVRVHSGPQADRSARALHARAYTLGADIVFGAGEYSPHSHGGQRLIAHELAHVIQQSGGAAVVQRKPARRDPQAEREAAVADAESSAGISSEQIVEQSDAEDALKLDHRRRADKKYGWKIGLKDRERLQKRQSLSPEFQRELTTKVRFFEGEGKVGYLQVIGPALSAFPAETVDILAEPEPKGPGLTAAELRCDVGKKEFMLEYEGAPVRNRCMDIVKDAEYRQLFDSNIVSAVAYAVEATTWENVEYDRFQLLLVKYRNGTSEFFVLDELGTFRVGKHTHGIVNHTYLKRQNGLVYPIVNGQIYFNPTITPNILSLKSSLKAQVKELQGLYTLIQTGGTFASIVGANGAVAGFRASVSSFKRPSSTLPGRRTRPPGSRDSGKNTGVPEPVEDQPTAKIRPGERLGETVGDYTISGYKGMQGDTFQRDIYGLFSHAGRTHDIRPIMGLVRSFMAEAKAAGATRLKIVGHAVGNEHVMKINRLATSLGGTSRPLGTQSIEIVIPLR